MLSTAAFMAIAMQCAVSVHPDTAHDVAKTESGFNPYAIGVVNGKSLYPSSLNEAMEQIKKLKADGKNYSVGLMQINKSNFSVYGVTASQAFDPCTNLKVFEKIITDCYRRGGTLKRALSCYYSGNFDTGQRPEKSFSQTSYVQRIGYVVPSTKADRMAAIQPEVTPQLTPSPTASKQVWPQKVVRGSLSSTDEKRATTRLVYPAQVVRGTLFNSSIAKETQ
ncbi:lytic transglycosylase domain-containing protein [Candidatus Pantoea soli]|uniref:TriA protein n=1 Tax=Candidatus Pantoea soli TaxID=3098669 RepID=A0A518XJY9_9GAMM|nr:lytic transglycosylase domain-containing protein [Pantoea soli]QDY44500.1 TriA protein [Pantoea soli]